VKISLWDSLKDVMMNSFKLKFTFLVIFLFQLVAGIQAEKKFALVIGSNYKGNKAGISELNLCEADASYMESQIRKIGSFEDVKVLLGKDVTKSNIEREIKSLGKRADSEDVVFLYFAGHGFYQRDASAKNGMRNYIVCYDRPHLSDDELNSYLENIKSPKTVFAFDCCFSGGIAKKGKKTRGDKEIPIPEGSQGVVKDTSGEDFFFQNKVIISSADDNQTAIELGGNINHGIFTYHFGKAMETADINGDKVITALEAFFKTRDDVQRTARDNDHEQVPQISGNASGIYLSGKLAPQPPEVTPVVLKPDPAPKPQPAVDPVKPEPAKPVITPEEPPAVVSAKEGDLLIKTTIIKDRRYGVSALPPDQIILAKNRKGARNVRVLIDDIPVTAILTSVKSDVWGVSNSKSGEIYNITVKKVPAGVHKIVVQADEYPEVVTTFAVLENKENILELTNSMTGFGVIQGQVFYKTLDNPVSNHPIYMPTINSVVNLKKVKTDEKGNFLFTALLPGEYEIKASFAEELALSNSMITVKEGQTTKLQIILNVKLPSTKTKY
jgi:hypothetical protein